MSGFHGDGHDDLGHDYDPFAPDEDTYFSGDEDEDIPKLKPE